MSNPTPEWEAYMERLNRYTAKKEEAERQKCPNPFCTRGKAWSFDLQAHIDCPDCRAKRTETAKKNIPDYEDE